MIYIIVCFLHNSLTRTHSLYSVHNCMHWLMLVEMGIIVLTVLKNIILRFYHYYLYIVIASDSSIGMKEIPSIASQLFNAEACS